MKDLLILATTKEEETLMQSLVEKNEVLYVEAVEVFLQRGSDRNAFLKLIFLISVAFGFVNAAKKFFALLFPRQTAVERLKKMLNKKQPVKRCSIEYAWRGEIFEAAMWLKLGNIFKNFRYRDIRSVALFCATLEEDVDMVRFLLKVKDVDVNCEDKNCLSPLYYSIIRNNLEITKLLLEHNARVDVNRIYSAKTLAILYGRDDQFKLLCTYT